MQGPSMWPIIRNLHFWDQMLPVNPWMAFWALMTATNGFLAPFIYKKLIKNNLSSVSLFEIEILIKSCNMPLWSIFLFWGCNQKLGLRDHRHWIRHEMSTHNGGPKFLNRLKFWNYDVWLDKMSSWVFLLRFISIHLKVNIGLRSHHHSIFRQILPKHTMHKSYTQKPIIRLLDQKSKILLKVKLCHHMYILKRFFYILNISP